MLCEPRLLDQVLLLEALRHLERDAWVAGVLYELLTLYACGYVYPLKIMATLAKQNSGS